MLRFLGAALLFGLICVLARSLGPARPAPDVDGTRELVRDALTGVYFPKDLAVKVVRGGETLHFQNVENRDRFLTQNR